MRLQGLPNFRLRREAKSRDSPHRFCQHLFIFFGLERTGGVHELSAKRQVGCGVAQNFNLEPMKFVELVRLQAPTNFGMPRQGARPGTGCVHQNPIKIRGERQWAHRVELSQANIRQFQALELSAHHAQPVAVQVCCDDAAFASGCSRQLGRFAPGSRTQIEHTVAGMDIQKKRYSLRRFILN